MELVLAFRRFDRPVRFEAFRGIRARAPWCFGIHRLSYHGSFLSSDGRRMVCRYTAPDAEAVRIPSRQYAVPFERITSVDPDGPARADAIGGLGEHLTAGETLVATESAILVPPETTGGPARHLLTYRSRDGSGDLHLFAVRAPGDSARDARLSTGTVWAAELYLPAAHTTSASY